MGPLALSLLLVLPCPTALEGDSTRLPAGCSAPVDGWLWTRPADAHREASLAEALSLVRDLELELTENAAALDVCAEAVLAEPPPPSVPPTSPWVWATLGVVAPVASVGVCSLAGCGDGRTLLAAVLAGGLTIGIAAW